MMPYWASSTSPFGELHEVAHQVLDVAADVAGLGELGGVGLDERHADEFGDAAHQVRLAHAGGAEQQDVLLGVIPLAQRRVLQALPHVVVVVADGNGEHFFGLGLLDDKAVEVIANLARLEVELADAPQGGLVLLVVFAACLGRRRGRARGRGGEECFNI